MTGWALKPLASKLQGMRMVCDAAVGASVIRDGEPQAEVSKDKLHQVLRLVSARLKANATKADGSTTQVHVCGSQPCKRPCACVPKVIDTPVWWLAMCRWGHRSITGSESLVM